MKRKILYFLSLILIWIVLTNCNQTYKEAVSEEREFYIDTVFYDEIKDLNELTVGEFSTVESHISIDSPRIANVSIKDESLQVKIIIDTFEVDSLKLQQISKKQDSLRVVELKTKKSEGDKLRPKEQKELVVYEYEVKQKNAIQQLNQLEEQHAKIDSLLKNK